jgi:hypothetical protein
MLGLPDGARACLFDLDGVLTDTASVHAAAWKQMFDDYLRARAERDGTPFRPFDVKDDYGPYVDGRPRLDGTRGFLESRGIELPEGSPDDPPAPRRSGACQRARTTSCRRRSRTVGVDVYPGSVRYQQAVKDAGLITACVSSSANAEQVLEVAGLQRLHRPPGRRRRRQAARPARQARARHLPRRRRRPRPSPRSRPSCSRTRWPGWSRAARAASASSSASTAFGHAERCGEHGADRRRAGSGELLS